MGNTCIEICRTVSLVIGDGLHHNSWYSDNYYINVHSHLFYAQKITLLFPNETAMINESKYVINIHVTS